MSEFDPAVVTGGGSDGPLVRTTGDLERGAADAIGPIFERTLEELGLGPVKAHMLMRQIAEAYMRGRAEGINVFPHQANRALSAEGIAIALALQHGALGPARARAGVGASEREALEVMARGAAHTVTVEAAVNWDEPRAPGLPPGRPGRVPRVPWAAGGEPRAPARDRRDPHGHGAHREGGA